MKIQKNSRQVPKQHSIIIEKYYSDILYSHLQVISNLTENQVRFLTKKDVNFSKLGEELGVTRQTISKRFNKLIELNLIIPDEENNIYILPKLSTEAAFLIPQDTLRKMVNALSENTINTYIYLANCFIANEERPTNFSIIAIKEFCGLSIKSSGNNYIIIDILEILSLLNLISYRSYNQIEDNQIKTYYQLTSVSNSVKKNDILC